MDELDFMRDTTLMSGSLRAQSNDSVCEARQVEREDEFDQNQKHDYKENSAVS